MDPSSAIGLIISIQQVLVLVYDVGKDIRNAKEEIRKLAVELSALKGTLEHVQLVYGFTDHNANDSKDALCLLETSSLSSDESKAMLQMTEDILKDLLNRLRPGSSNTSKAWKRITWRFEKADINAYLERIERAKSWFTFAATTDNVASAQQQFRKLCDIDRKLESQEQRTTRLDADQLNNDIREWLAPRNSEDYYRQSLDQYQPGTCSWFLDGVFQEWICGKDLPGLWLKARPGFGKTTLIAGAIDRVKRLSETSNSNTVVAFWFCSFTEQHAHNLQTFLATMIYQLCCSESSLFAKLNRLYPQRKTASGDAKQNRLTSAELIKLFISLVSDVELALLIVDALNESEYPDELVKSLNEISGACTNVRFLISSTDSATLDADISRIHVITTNDNTNVTDIELYIESWLSARKHMPDDLKREILSSVQKNANGVFRWVQCQLQELSTLRTIQAMRDALQRLPKSLEEYYQSVLNHIREGDRQLAQNLLMWLKHARRRMRFAELCEAVVLPKIGRFDATSMRLLRSDDILEICPSLITYDPLSSTVTLAHSSVFQFLLRSEYTTSLTEDLHYSWRTGEYMTAKHCLSYMMLPEFTSGYLDKVHFATRRAAWPLLDYIAKALWDHLYRIDPSGPIQSLLFEFVHSSKLPKGGNFGAWAQAYIPLIPESSLIATTPLYWAAREGHLPLVRVLLASGGIEDLERGGGMFSSTPLHVASWAGHTSIVRELLLAGADINEVNSKGASGLSWAKKLGYTDIVELLENAKVEAKLSGPFAHSETENENEVTLRESVEDEVGWE